MLLYLDHFSGVRPSLLDPENAIRIEPFGSAMWPHFAELSLALARPV